MLSITGEVFQRRDGSYVIRANNGDLRTLNELLEGFDIPLLQQRYPAERDCGKLLTITVADSVDSPYRG